MYGSNSQSLDIELADVRTKPSHLLSNNVNIITIYVFINVKEKFNSKDTSLHQVA